MSEGTFSQSRLILLIQQYSLTFTTLWAHSADDKLVIFFFYFSQKTGFDISCKLSPMDGDNLHEMSNLVFWKNKEKKIKMLSAENFTHSAKRLVDMA